MKLHEEILLAHERLAGRVRLTPVEHSPWLSELGQCRVHLKLENQQLTGSFKLRGALNKLATLDAAELARGVVTASTGNHGAAVACGARELGYDALIFAPSGAAASKLDCVRAFGAEVRLAGDDCVEAEATARAFAASEGRAYVSPYNDLQVVAGQGTLGVELHEQLPDLDAVFVSVGGGGLIAGIAGFLKSTDRPPRIFACSPRNSCVLQASLEAGEILDLPSEPTLSDGTAGGVEADTITFAMCQELIDEFILVDEDEIRVAMRGVIGKHHTLIEGAAATAVASFIQVADRMQGLNVAILLCGANVDSDVLRGVLD